MNPSISSTGKHGLSTIVVDIAGTGTAKISATDREGSLNLEVALPHRQEITIDLAKDVTYRIDVLMLSGRLDSCTATTPEGTQTLPTASAARSATSPRIGTASSSGCSVSYTP
ncbi:hypothetical protein ACMYYO_09010 [Dermacoccaceae bacterium W4C1]